MRVFGVKIMNGWSNKATTKVTNFSQFLPKTAKEGKICPKLPTDGQSLPKVVKVLKDSKLPNLAKSIKNWQKGPRPGQNCQMF